MHILQTQGHGSKSRTRNKLSTFLTKFRGTSYKHNNLALVFRARDTDKVENMKNRTLLLIYINMARDDCGQSVDPRDRMFGA